MSSISKAAALQKAFEVGGLTEVFVGHLGWEGPKGTVPSVQVDDDV